MNVAIYGGSFDPVHNGHLAVARAAAERFKLKRIYFVPANIQPLKQGQASTPYYHRYAMLSLALAGEKDFVPSLLEAPEIMQAEGLPASYSIDTITRLKNRLKKSDKLYFLVGIDAFLSIGKWRSAVELLRSCEFIVVSRPGFSLADVAEALPEEVRPPERVTRVFRGQQATGEIMHAGVVIHLLSGVQVDVSSTKIRNTARAGKSVARFVPEAVSEYIKKLKLYQPEEEPGSPEAKPTSEVAAKGAPTTPAVSPEERRGKLQIVHRRGHTGSKSTHQT